MASILLISLDPETREILKLRFEVDGISVATALGERDAAPIIKANGLDCVVIDLIDCSKEELKEAALIEKVSTQAKIRSVLIAPRGFTSLPLKADLVIRKPYDLNGLVAGVEGLINNPRKSCSSRRGPRQRS